MTRPIDRLGFGPTYTCADRADGSVSVMVTPPSFMRTHASTVTLTSDQFARFLRWQSGADLIQNLLPDLSPSDREILMTGLDDAAFAAAASPEGE